MRYNLEDLKTNYVGKQFNWLTVVDFIKICNYFEAKCKCKCGNIKSIRSKAFSELFSNKIKSCGCYKHSEEFKKLNSDRKKQWRIENPEKAKQTDEYCKNWYLYNKDKILENTNKYLNWCNLHKNDLITKGIRHSEYFRNMRLNIAGHINNDFIHPDDLEKFKLGLFKGSDLIRTKCPSCDEYDYHSTHNVFHYKLCDLKRTPLCHKCFNSYESSKYESEIAEYISTLYNGVLIRNSREIISPLELDLYYPEKKIAIEFNGDYWHSNKFCDNCYHYNKFNSCREKDISLVSIFESEWNNRKGEIKSYLKDLFNGISNSISFSDNKMNNNYPLPGFISNELNFDNYIEDYYIFNNYKVYTCGYTTL
jgi:hypothetical protein